MRRPRVRVYVSSLLLVPLIGFALLAAIAAGPRYSDWHRYRIVDEKVERIATMLDLSRAIGQEELPTQIIASIRRLNLSSDAAAAVLGFDPKRRESDSREHVDRLLQRHAHMPEVRHVQKALAELRRESDRGAPDTEINRRFVMIHQEFRGEWQRERRSPELQAIDGRGGLRDSLAALDLVMTASDSVTDQHQVLVQLLTSDVRDDLTMRSKLAVLRFVEKDSLTKAEARVREPRRKSLVAVREVSETSSVVAEIERYVAGETVTASEVGPLRMAAAIRGGVERGNEMNAFVSLIISDVRTSSQKLKGSVTNALILTLAMAALLAIVSAAVAFFIARLLALPLRALAGQARVVAEGELDVPAMELRGPMEVAVVAATINDLVANLRRIQGQAAALAKGEIDHAILSASIPGALGKTMKASVDRLSRSIREREELQEQLTNQATHDSLTGLPNRAAALIALENAMARARRSASPIAVLFIDLDDFKRANDDHSHLVGDEVLRVTGARICSMVRAGDLVARLGGDEFLVIADSVDSAQEASEVAERVIGEVCEPIIYDGVTVRVGASIGFAMSTDTTGSASEFLRCADLAMYRAKELGRGRVVQFEERMNRESEERQELEQQMFRALANETLALHYQPIVDATNGRIKSVEALLRWNRPGYGYESPSHFIPILESSPLILDIGRWVLIEGAKATERLRRDHEEFRSLSVAVNLSGRHLLAPSLLQDVRSALELSGLDPTALTIEITETALVADLATAVENLRSVRALGVRVAIDDFGTGYTSVGQLSRLPIDVLKIDRSFIDQIDSPANQRIVELIIEVGHTLGLDVVGEGIEDEHQRAVLQRLGCDRIQGYLFGRAMPAHALAQRVTNDVEQYAFEGSSLV